MVKPIIVVKVGGSLFDWPELGPRLHEWLRTLAPAQILLVPGGGATVNAVRDLDHSHNLGEEASHWLALRALTLNAHFLATVLASLRATVVADFQQCQRAWTREELPILDAFEFARMDESHPDHLPHLWSASSDSVAATVAVRIKAQRLVLLKSKEVPDGDDWMNPDLALVDPIFPGLVKRAKNASPRLDVSAVNLRH
jgi:5-(aminomethyl)-3-furanmethanol phosphate kinase